MTIQNTQTNKEIRIEEIRKVTLNGVKKKAFKAFVWDEDIVGYVLAGEFAVPARTPNKNLHLFVTNGDE
jgi:hypothetical protein